MSMLTRCSLNTSNANIRRLDSVSPLQRSLRIIDDLDQLPPRATPVLSPACHYGTSQTTPQTELNLQAPAFDWELKGVRSHISHHRRYFDYLAKTQFNIQTFHDWYRCKTTDVFNLPSSVLSSYYQSSL